MKVTQTALEKLKTMQPELVHGKNELSGCFYLSATYKHGHNKKYPSEVSLYRWDIKDRLKDSCFIHDYFYIRAKWMYNDGLSIVVHETGGKIQKWMQTIPHEYWHLNGDGSLCLATQSDMSNLREKYECFAEFFNMIVSQYFYQMAFLHKYEIEPWGADRHGLFKALDLFYDSDILTLGEKKEIIGHLYCDSRKLGNLLEKTGYRKIRSSSRCPFCSENKHTKKSRDCHIHKTQIKGYNKFIRHMLEEERVKKNTNFYKK